MKSFNARTYLYIAGGGILLMLALALYSVMSPVSKSEQTEYLYIDEDDTLDSVMVKIGAFSHTAGTTGLSMLIRHSDYGNHIRTGRYAIEPHEGAVMVFRHLRNGQQKSMHLTIPEFRTMDRLAAYLSSKLMMDSTAVMDALTDSAVCSRLGYTPTTIPALFVPNTYDVWWNASVDQFLQRMQREHDQFWRGDREEKAAAIGLSPVEVCTLASIIDEETSNQAEKPMIAGMYMNRLKAGMPLQADPTIKFALRQFELKRIYHKLLDTDSPFNTYRHTGLPPGPIKIASVKGIDGVLNLVEHNYLYMCAKEDFSGTHNFARTYQEHLKNAARYSKALNERGIK